MPAVVDKGQSESGNEASRKEGDRDGNGHAMAVWMGRSLGKEERRDVGWKGGECCWGRRRGWRLDGWEEWLLWWGGGGR